MTIIIAVLAGIAEGVYLIPKGMKKEFSAAVFILLTATILQIGSNSGVMTRRTFYRACLSLSGESFSWT